MDRFQLFASPVAVLQLPDVEELNRELARRLLEEERCSAGVLRSNAGGWHSAPDLSRRGEPCFQALMQRVVDHVGLFVGALAQDAGRAEVPALRFGVQAWAMIMGRGDYTILHAHGDAHWSTAYYVDAGDGDPEAHPGSGLLALVDPGRGGRLIEGLDLFPSTFTIAPRTGALVIFPGWLQHYVHPYQGTRPRISISCNLVLEAERGAAGQGGR